MLVEGAAGAGGDRGLEDRVHLVRPVQAGGVLGGTRVRAVRRRATHPDLVPATDRPARGLTGAARRSAALCADDERSVDGAAQDVVPEQFDEVLRRVPADRTADPAAGVEAERSGDPGSRLVAWREQDSRGRHRVDPMTDRRPESVNARRAASAASVIGSTGSSVRCVIPPAPTSTGVRGVTVTVGSPGRWR